MGLKKKRVTSFNLKANKDFRDKLGKITALAAMMETATLQLIKQQQESGEDFNIFLNQKATDVGMQLTDLSVYNHRAIQNKLYLVFPYSCFDSFIQDFIKEVRVLIDSDFKLVQKDDASNLERLLDALKKKGIIPQISKCQLLLFHYYRLIRNAVAHTTIGEKEIDRLFAKLNHEEIHSLFPTIQNAGNINNICFNDYKLCCANIIYIAELITISIEKHIDWNYPHFKTIREIDYRRVLRFKDNKKRQSNYINGCFRRLFGIDCPQKAKEKIISEVTII